MREWEKILHSVVNPDSDLEVELSDSLDTLNISVTEFSDQSGISKSLLYKITSGHRTNIQLDTFKQIVQECKKIEQGQQTNERSIAIISNRESLEHIRERVTIEGVDVVVQSYPSSTVEEAIRQSIIAERDGVDAIICGPITAYTIEEIVHTPVIGLDITNEQIEQAVELAVKKTTRDD